MRGHCKCIFISARGFLEVRRSKEPKASSSSTKQSSYMYLPTMHTNVERNGDACVDKDGVGSSTFRVQSARHIVPVDLDSEIHGVGDQ